MIDLSKTSFVKANHDHDNNGTYTCLPMNFQAYIYKYMQITSISVIGSSELGDIGKAARCANNVIMLYLESVTANTILEERPRHRPALRRDIPYESRLPTDPISVDAITHACTVVSDQLIMPHIFVSQLHYALLHTLRLTLLSDFHLLLLSFSRPQSC